MCHLANSKQIRSGRECEVDPSSRPAMEEFNRANESGEYRRTIAAERWPPEAQGLGFKEGIPARNWVLCARMSIA